MAPPRIYASRAEGQRTRWHAAHPGSSQYAPRPHRTIRRTRDQIREDRLWEFELMLDEQRARVMDTLLNFDRTLALRRQEEEPFMLPEAELLEYRH